MSLSKYEPSYMTCVLPSNDPEESTEGSWTPRQIAVYAPGCSVNVPDCSKSFQTVLNRLKFSNIGPYFVQTVDSSFKGVKICLDHPKVLNKISFFISFYLHSHIGYSS